MYNVYCDGSCLHNQRSRGRGGYGYVIVDGKKIYENSGCINNKTSNAMELIAVITAVKDVIKLNSGEPAAVVQVFSDSDYVVRNWRDRLAVWVDNDWKTKSGNDVCNRRYWEILFDMRDRFALLTLNWCRGHADNRFQNRADALAKEARNGRSKLP